VLPYLMAWIEGKGGGHSGVNPVSAKAMRELTSIVREWIDEDRNAGRPSMIPYVDGLMADTLLIDRRDRGQRGLRARRRAASSPNPEAG
jgi:hypothetical protein